MTDQQPNNPVNNTSPSSHLGKNNFRDLLIMLPWFAVLILVSPFLNIVSPDFRLFGVPFRFLQLFGSWALLIGLVAMCNIFIARANKREKG